MSRLLREVPSPTLDSEETAYGLRITTRRPINDAIVHLRITNMVFPHAFVIPLSREVSITQWHVPVDDTHCYWYAAFTSFAAPMDKTTMRAQRLANHSLPDYVPHAGRSNDWGYDAAEQRTATYTGMGMDINVHDQWAVEGMGAIQDRTREHLGYSDRIITAARRMIFRAIDDGGRGTRPAADARRRPCARSRHDRLRRPGRGHGRLLAVGGSGAAARHTLARAGAGDCVSDFVARHDLWAQPQQDAAAEVAERIGKLDVVRFAFSDAHGVVRGKTLVAAEAIGALRRGVTCTLTMLLKDLSGRTAFSIFEPGGDGAGDMVMVADPTTFRVLPWVPNNGWILCDLYRTDGSPHPFSTRALMRRMLGQLAERGLAWRAGLEVEFHLLRCTDAVAAADHIAMPGPPPAVTPLNHGYQYLTELRYDAVEPLLETLRRQPAGTRPAAALAGGRVRAEPGRGHVRRHHRHGTRRPDAAVPQRDEAGLRPRRLSCQLHVPAAPAACGIVRLASASFDRGHRHRPQSVP